MITNFKIFESDTINVGDYITWQEYAAPNFFADIVGKCIQSERYWHVKTIIKNRKGIKDQHRTDEYNSQDENDAKSYRLRMIEYGFDPEISIQTLHAFDCIDISKDSPNYGNEMHHQFIDMVHRPKATPKEIQLYNSLKKGNQFDL